MTETPKCTSWLGHNFEARYSTTAPSEDMVTAMNGMTVQSVHVILQDLTNKTYEGDICVRCGFVIERKTPETASKPTT